MQPSLYQPVCVMCNKPREQSSKCQNCESGAAPLPCQQLTLSSPTPRPPIRSQPSPGPNSIQQNFYKPVTAVRATRIEALPVRVTNARGTPLINGRTPLLAGTSGCCATRTPTQKRAAQQPELNDPSESGDGEDQQGALQREPQACSLSSAVVLSSDEEDADNASTGSANRLESVSPRPADSAHSSPAPCGSGGRVEAAVKNTAEQDELGLEFFEDVHLKVTIPRRARMKDQVRDPPLTLGPP